MPHRRRPLPAPADHAPAVSRGALVGVALLLLGLGIAGWLDLRHESAVLREEAARRLTAAEAAVAQSREREGALAGDLREAQAKLALLETRLAESQSQQAALEALYRELRAFARRSRAE